MAFLIHKEKSCCGSFSLKTGTLIILVILLLSSVYGMFQYIDSILMYHKVISGIGIRAYSTLIDAWVQWIFGSMFAISLLFYLIPYTLAVYDDLSDFIEAINATLPKKAALHLPEDASATLLSVVIATSIFGFAIIGCLSVIVYHFTCVAHSYYLKMKEEDVLPRQKRIINQPLA